VRTGLTVFGSASSRLIEQRTRGVAQRLIIVSDAGTKDDAEPVFLSRQGEVRQGKGFGARLVKLFLHVLTVRVITVTWMG